MRQGNILLISLIVIGVLILGISGLFIYRNYHLPSPVYNTQPKEVPEKEKTASTSEKSSQNISTSTSMGVLVAEDFKASFKYPKEWGQLSSKDEKDIYAVKGSVGQTTSISNYPFLNLYNTFTEPFRAKGGARLFFLRYPQTFVDVDPNLGPWYDTPTKEAQAQIFAPLIKIYNEKNISSLPLNVEQSGNSWTLISDAPDIKLGWWGNGGAFQHRFSMEYVENSDGKLRGVAYFANEAQDAAFSPVYIVALINPDSRIVLVSEFDLGTMPEIQEVIKKRGEVKYEGDGAKSLGYKSLAEICYSYLRNPENYKNTELGKLLKTINEIILSVKLTQPN